MKTNYIARDGTRIFLDSVMLNDIFQRNNADEIKEMLFKEIIKTGSFPTPTTGDVETEKGDNAVKVVFVCDRRKCDKCETNLHPKCTHTHDIRHAKNFVLNGDIFEEIER